jgi:prephenate dehydrogenase
LGGVPRLRRAAVIGAGARATSLAAALARAGLEVDLATGAGGGAAASRANGAEPRAVTRADLPDGVRVTPASALELQHHDVVFIAVPARELPEAVAAHAPRIPGRAGVVLVRPPATGSPAGGEAEPFHARAVASLHVAGDASEPLSPGDAVVVACPDGAFLAQIAEVLRRAGLKVKRTSDETETTASRPRRRRAA